MTTTTVTTHATVRRRSRVDIGAYGCHGNAIYRLSGHISGIYGIDPERILGRPLGEGTILSITITVATEAPMPTKCINPTSGHAGQAPKADGLPTYISTECIGHPERKAET